MSSPAAPVESLEGMFRQHINELMALNGVTQTELGRRMGVSHTYAHVYLSGKRPFSLPIAERFLWALGYRVPKIPLVTNGLPL